MIDHPPSGKSTAPGESDVQDHGCDALYDLARDSPTAIAAASGIELATAAMARLPDDSGVQYSCQRALNRLDPPPFLAAICLCALVGAAARAVAMVRRSHGEPAWSRAGWGAAFLLNLGLRFILGTWAVVATARSRHHRPRLAIDDEILFFNKN